MSEIDEADRRILRAIQKNPSLTMRELGEVTGISHTPCWRRLQRLQELGVISEKRHSVNPAAVGFEVTLLCFIRIKEHTRERLSAFEEAVQNVPEIIQCYSLTGNFDYVVQVLAKSVNHYESTVKNALVELPNVGSISSSLILREVKKVVDIPV